MFTSPDIHQLITSLSQSERRLFKLRATQTGKSSTNYLRLFDAISAQESYDEEEIKALFKGERFINNFSVAKAYLYQSILDSLRQRRVRKSPEMAVREMIDHIEILFQRGLPAQAQKILERAVKKARNFDLVLYQTELTKWQRQLINLRSRNHRTENLLEIESAESKSFQLASQEATFQSLRAMLQAIFLQNIDLRAAQTGQQVADLMKHPLLSKPPQKLSFLSQLYFHEIFAVYHRMEGDASRSLNAYQKAIQLWEMHPAFAKAYPDKYLQSLTSFLDACLREAEYPDFQKQIQKIYQMDPVEPRLKARAFYLGNHLDLRYAITTYQFKVGLRRVRHIENGLKKHKLHLSPSIELTFQYNLAILYFLSQDYQQAIPFINLVRNQGKSPVRQDIIDAARMIELVCHFELRNFELLESLLRSNKRFLKSHPRQHSYETILLKGLRRLLDLPSNQTRPIFEELKKEFEAMEGASYLIGREELMLWILSYLEGKPPSEMEPPRKKRKV